MKKKSGNFLIIIGIVFIICAAALTAYNIWDDERAGRAADNALEGLNQIISSTEVKGSEGTPLYKLNPEIPMPEVEIDGEKYIGKIAVPNLNLELPVISQWSDAKLNTAPCRYKGSVYMDDMIIAGHSYVNHLRPIRKITVGEKVLFTDAEDNKFNFEVISVEVLQANQGEILEQEGDWDLTIFTCTPAGQARFIVRCVKMEE